MVTVADLSIECSSINEVIDALSHPSFYYTWVKQPTMTTLPMDEDTYSNPKFAPMTRRCLGAIDGTHIP